MVHAQRRVRRRIFGEGRQRHLSATGSAHINAVERIWGLPVLGSGLHHHVILIEWRVDRGDLSLAKGVVERGVDEPWGDEQASGGVAIDDQ